MMAARDSFIESFLLFGYNLDDYEQLSAEKLDLLVLSEFRPHSGRIVLFLICSCKKL